MVIEHTRVRCEWDVHEVHRAVFEEITLRDTVATCGLPEGLSLARKGAYVKLRVENEQICGHASGQDHRRRRDRDSRGERDLVRHPYGNCASHGVAEQDCFLGSERIALKDELDGFLGALFGLGEGEG